MRHQARRGPGYTLTSLVLVVGWGWVARVVGLWAVFKRLAYGSVQGAGVVKLKAVKNPHMQPSNLRRPL